VGACRCAVFCGGRERDSGNELRLASLCDFVPAQLLACSAPCVVARPEKGWFGVEALLDAVARPEGGWSEVEALLDAWGCPEALQHQCVL